MPSASDILASLDTSRSEPRWLGSTDVAALHRSQSDALLREPGILDGAVASPRMLYHYGDHPDLIALAVRMMLRIAQDHPFIDGNKRAGFYSGLAFLLVNGVSVSFEDVVDPNGRLFKDAVTGDVTEASYAQWLRLTVLGTMVLAGGRASSPSE